MINDFPMSKYKFYTDNKTCVVAVSTYQGKTVKGVAKCAPSDTFDYEFGKKIAAEKCNRKVNRLRVKYMNEMLKNLEYEKDWLWKREAKLTEIRDRAWDNVISSNDKLHQLQLLQQLIGH